MSKIYDDQYLERQLKVQRAKEWSLEDLKFTHIDLTKPFIPLKKEALFKDFNEDELLVLSQFLGLIINATISELEDVLQAMKTVCFDDVMDKYPSNPEMIALGEQFFQEEKKHSLAFKKFLHQFAKQTNVQANELESILPQVDQEYIKKTLEFNHKMGGCALWWIVAAVEEESILIYKSIQNKKVESSFKKLHRLHFEEEVRHANYAFLMLELLNTRVDLSPKKMNFICGEILQISWSLGQLLKAKGIKKLAKRHMFYEKLEQILPKIYNRSPLELINMLFKQTPYLMLILNPASNKKIEEYLKNTGEFKLPRKTVDLESFHE